MDDDEVAPVPVYIAVGEPVSDPDAPRTGRWEVLTESGSRYVLDLDLELLTRIRGTEQPDDPDVLFPVKLRDHSRSAVRLLRILKLEVGSRAVFDIESLSDDPDVAFTRRRTTFVREIRPLPDNGTKSKG